MKKEYRWFTRTKADKILADYWAVTLPFLFFYLRVKPAKWATAWEALGNGGFFFLGLHFSFRR